MNPERQAAIAAIRRVKAEDAAWRADLDAAYEESPYLRALRGPTASQPFRRPWALLRKEGGQNGA